MHVLCAMSRDHKRFNLFLSSQAAKSSASFQLMCVTASSSSSSSSPSALSKLHGVEGRDVLEQDDVGEE